MQNVRRRQGPDFYIPNLQGRVLSGRTVRVSGHSACSGSDPSEHFGRDGPRFDHDNLHSRRLDLMAQCIADRFEGKLRAGVRAAGRHCHLAADGGGKSWLNVAELRRVVQ